VAVEKNDSSTRKAKEMPEEMSEGEEAENTETEEEEAEDSEDEAVKPESDAGDTTGSETDENGSSSDEDSKRKIGVLKRKLKSKKNAVKNKKAKKEVKKSEKKVVKAKKPIKTIRKEKNVDETAKASTSGGAQRVETQLKEKDSKDSTGEEKKYSKDEGKVGENDKSADDKATETENAVAGKRVAPDFNDKNLDYNLYKNDPENVVAKKIKISSTVIVNCRMIENLGTLTGISYDYAALSFVKKMAKGKSFEFSLPLNLAHKIIEALKLIIQDNPKYFENHK
jgi:hypothetical protein